MEYNDGRHYIRRDVFMGKPLSSEFEEDNGEKIDNDDDVTDFLPSFIATAVTAGEEVNSAQLPDVIIKREPVRTPPPLLVQKPFSQHDSLNSVIIKAEIDGCMRNCLLIPSVGGISLPKIVSNAAATRQRSASVSLPPLSHQLPLVLASPKPKRRKLRRSLDKLDPRYKEERLRNNISVKKCRARKVAYYHRLESMYKDMHSENMKLKESLAIAENENRRLKSILDKVGVRY